MVKWKPRSDLYWWILVLEVNGKRSVFCRWISSPCMEEKLTSVDTSPAQEIFSTKTLHIFIVSPFCLLLSQHYLPEFYLFWCFLRIYHWVMLPIFINTFPLTFWFSLMFVLLTGWFEAGVWLWHATKLNEIGNQRYVKNTEIFTVLSLKIRFTNDFDPLWRLQSCSVIWFLFVSHFVKKTVDFIVNRCLLGVGK